MWRYNNSYYGGYLLIFLDLQEYLLKEASFNLPISFIFNLPSERTLDESFQYVLTIYALFLFFKILYTSHLVFQLYYSLFKWLLLFLQCVWYLLLHRSLPFNDFIPYFVEYSADFTPVFISRLFQLNKVILYPMYLMLYFVLFLQCSLERHIKDILFLLASFLKRHDFMSLMVFIKDAVDAKKFLV